MSDKLIATVTFKLRESAGASAGGVEMMVEPADGLQGAAMLDLLMNCTTTMGRGVLRMCDAMEIPRTVAITELGNRLAKLDLGQEMYLADKDGDKIKL